MSAVGADAATARDDEAAAADGPGAAMPAGTAPALAARVERLEHRFPQNVLALPSGARLGVRTAGARGAPAVVLLHGIGSGAASWFDVAEALADAARVVAWEAPGYGASSPCEVADGDVNAEAVAWAARLGEALALLDLDEVVLVGHSLGALVAAAFATGPAAARVRRLVLLSPAGGYGAPERAAERARVRAGRLAALAERGVAGIAADAPDRMLGAAASAEARAWVRWNAARLDAAGYAQAVELLCHGDLGAAAGRLAMPCEVHVGDADVVTPPAACRAIAERLGASFATIEGAGHASPVERGAEVARRIAGAAGAVPGPTAGAR